MVLLGRGRLAHYNPSWLENPEVLVSGYPLPSPLPLPPTPTPTPTPCPGPRGFDHYNPGCHEEPDGLISASPPLPTLTHHRQLLSGSTGDPDVHRFQNTQLPWPDTLGSEVILLQRTPAFHYPGCPGWLGNTCQLGVRNTFAFCSCSSVEPPAPIHSDFEPNPSSWYQAHWTPQGTQGTGTMGGVLST